MRLIRMAKPVILALTLCVTSAVAIVLAEGNDFVIGDLRVDLSEVYNARDYKVHLLANDKPSSGSDDDFTTAWLGVFLAQYIPGVPDSGQFSQVGLLTKKDGIRWFVYAEPTVTCLRGWHDPDDDRHCYGFVNDLVALGSWHQMELVKYTQNNYWIARVYDSNGIAYDVAKIWSDSNRIYLARSDTEEGYVESSDPYLTASFYHWHPWYMKWGTGWQEWPESSGDNCNSIWTEAINGPDPCPAHYGADPYWTGDPRAWFAGTGGKWCDVDPLFPATYTYLPDIKANYNGWNSTIIVRNNGGGDAHVQVAFYDSNGTIAAYPINTHLAGQAIWTLDASTVLSNFNGSAVVTASEDVSVVVRNTRGSEITIYNGIRASGGSPGWEQVGTTLYAPVAKNNWYGRYSIIEVLNAGGTDTTVTVKYYLHDSGEQQGGPSTQTLPPNARGTFYASSRCPSGQYCAAVITSGNGQPLAAVVHEYEGGGGAPTTYNAFSAAATTGYAPMVKKNWGDSQNTGVTVMNTTAQWALVDITYYGDDEANPGYEYHESFWLHPSSVTCRWTPLLPLPDPFLGSAVVNATQDVVVLVGEQGAGAYKSTNGFLGGASVAYIPELFNYASGPWSGITVQNLDASQTARVRVHYYNPDGSFRQTIGPRDISPGEEYSFHYWNNGLPDNFHGSGWVESEWGQPVGVLVNEARALGGAGYDGQASFNGSQP